MPSPLRRDDGPGAAGATSRRGRRLAAAGAVLVALAVAGGTIIAASIGSGGALGPPRFVDETASVGIEHAYDGDFNYFVGGGVAAFDCDADGDQDLYLAGGAMPAALYRNDSAVGAALRFSPIADSATDLGAVVGAYPLDVDGDGATDLAVLRLGENVVLRGIGGCRFERANERFGIDGGTEWTTAFSATWEGSAALPTMAFGNYLELDANDEWTGKCLANELLRPDASGTSYGPPTALTPGWCALSLLFSDWDRSGRRDLRVSNDRHYYGDYSGGEEQLWKVVPGEQPHLYAEADGWQTLKIWGMGIASQDLDGDGYPEIYLTSQGDNKLETLADGPAEPKYENIAVSHGAAAGEPFAGGDTLPSTAWHAEFEDVNNDGFMDLFVTKGNVEAMPDYASRDPSNLLIGRADGMFTESAEAAGILNFARARGGALVDFNLDGLLDLVQVNRRENVKVWRNVGAGTAEAPASLGHWLGIQVADPERSNRDAIGAWVAVRVGDRTIQREVTVGGGHAGGQLGPIHVGLGSADRADVQVTWPDGEIGPWVPVAADRFVTIDRGAFEALPWPPRRP